MTRIAILFALAGCWRDPAPEPVAPAPTPTPTLPAPTPQEPGQPPGAPAAVASANDACTRDTDCVITNFAGCCACPGCTVGAPTARSVFALDADQKQCAVIRCDLQRCATLLCKPGEDASLFSAACRNGVCVGARK